jgi:predicted dehydrogenase
MHCPELDKRSDRFRIVAACDVDAERLRRIAERYGCRTHADIAALIADPDVELVDITSRSCDHVAHTLAALKARRTVFLEKPMTTTYADAVRLKAAARRYRAKLYIRHNRRFEPAFQHIREIIASGLLGEVFEIKLRRNGYQRRDDWQTLIRYGGGQMLNWGPHIIDQALRLLESPVAEIWGDLKRVAAVGDAEDHVHVILKGRNGRTVDLEISGGAAIGEPTYLVLGRRGALSSDEREIRLRYLDPDTVLPERKPIPDTPAMDGGFGTPDALAWVEKTIPVQPSVPCQMDDIWDHLYATIREGKPFPITLDQAVEVMRVVSTVKRGTPFERPVRR